MTVAQRIIETAVESALDVEDAALDYVETHLGPNFFAQNWQRMVAQGSAKTSVSAWLKTTSHEVGAEEVVQELTRLYDAGTAWLTPFTTKLPPEA